MIAKQTKSNIGRGNMPNLRKLNFSYQLSIYFLFYQRYSIFAFYIFSNFSIYQHYYQDSQMDQVQEVLDQTEVQGKPYYLIEWKDYHPSISTWEPIQNLLNQLDKVHQWKMQNSPTFIKSPLNKSLQQEMINDKKESTLRARFLSNHPSQKIKNERKSQYVILDDDDDNQKFSQGQIDEISEYCHKKKIKRAKSNTKNIYDFKEKVSREKNVFKIIGKVRKMQIKSILDCFEWEDNKICQVLLNDGRKVNMRKDDVRNICPEKLYKYYDQL